MMSDYANMMPGLFQSTEGGTQFYKSGRRACGLSSEFCAVWLLLELENLSALQNTGGSAFQGCGHVRYCGHFVWPRMHLRMFVYNHRGFRKVGFHCIQVQD